MTQQIVIVDQNDADFVRRLAAEHDVQVREIPVRGIEPILTVTLVLLNLESISGVLTR
jgi:hypothetical protein